jgi:hypothetical protein
VGKFAATDTPVVGLTIRNAMQAWAGCYMTAIAAFFLFVNLASGFGLRWWGVAIMVLFGALGARHFVVWRRTTVQVGDDGLRVTGVVRDRSIPWNAIERIELRPAEERSLFRRPKTDQARARLTNGSEVRVPAIQPWYPSTVFGLPRYISARTKADHLVASLNEICDAKRGEH